MLRGPSDFFNGLLDAEFSGRVRSRGLAWLSGCVLIWALAARVFGPCDAYDQDQPRTMAYTTDIIVHGRWILPIERGRIPATKPPLYNWLAVPAVRALGFSSDFAHKLPSVVALCLLWSTLVLVAPGPLGWLSALLFVCNFAVFKLAYLARPDMVLALWLFWGWIAASVLLIAPPPKRTARVAFAVGFWLCVALAALTKGPAALLLPLYALLASKSLGGRWAATRVFGWWWGIPLSTGLFGAWAYAVYRIDSTHLLKQLLFNEFFGRITGTGSEGTGGRGPIDFVRRLGFMPLYFMGRFAPWSILTLFAIVALVRQPEREAPRPWRSIPGGPWLLGATIQVVLVVAFFSFSAGKRGDYVLPALAPAAMLAAWFLLRRGVGAGVVSVIAVTTMLCMIGYLGLQLSAPVRGFGSEIHRFIREVESHLEADPRPVAFLNAGESQLQGHLGFSELDGRARSVVCSIAARPSG